MGGFIVLLAMVGTVSAAADVQAQGGGTGTSGARTTPPAPRDIVDLLDSGAVEIRTAGSGIDSVTVEIRKLVDGPIVVRIPVGSFFVSASAAAQNMVATGARTITLATKAWRTVSVPTACANRPRDIPESGDTFTVARSPSQTDLAQLMPVLEKANASYAVRQAAVWIVTDNADYDDLGILVESTTGFGGTRVINEAAAARAMKLCEDAGIDITRKAIWSDRARMLSGLAPGATKTWLAARQ